MAVIAVSFSPMEEGCLTLLTDRGSRLLRLTGFKDLTNGAPGDRHAGQQNLVAASPSENLLMLMTWA